MEKGFLFENWLVAELIRIKDYYSKEHQFSFWRKKNQELDILISDGRGPKLAIECKSGKTEVHSATIDAFKKAFPGVQLIVASLNDRRPRKIGSIDTLPWKDVLTLYRDL